MDKVNYFHRKFIKDVSNNEAHINFNFEVASFYVNVTKRFKLNY